MQIELCTSWGIGLFAHNFPTTKEKVRIATTAIVVLFVEPMFPCPCCDGPLLTTDTSPLPPLMFVPCGHTVCSACGEAVETATAATGEGSAREMVCCVCAHVARSAVPNHGVVAAILEGVVPTTPETGTEERSGTLTSLSRQPPAEPPLPQRSTASSAVAAASVSFSAVSIPTLPPRPSTSLPSSGPGFWETGRGVPCRDHPRKEAFCFCLDHSVPVCETCVKETHAGHAFASFGTGRTRVEGLVARFVQDISHLEVAEEAVVSGLVELADTHEVALETTAATFRQLHEMLSKAETSMVHTLAKERRRRQKVLEAQAAELATSVAQARVVVKTSKLALDRGDPYSLSAAHALVSSSIGLLDGVMFLLKSQLGARVFRGHGRGGAHSGRELGKRGEGPPTCVCPFVL